MPPAFHVMVSEGTLQLLYETVAGTLGLPPNPQWPENVPQRFDSASPSNIYEEKVNILIYIKLLYLYITQPENLHSELFLLHFQQSSLASVFLGSRQMPRHREQHVSHQIRLLTSARKAVIFLVGSSSSWTTISDNFIWGHYFFKTNY